MNKIKSIVGVFMSFLFLNIQGFAQQSEPKMFSLQGAVDFAKKNNYTLKNNILDIQASEKKVKEVLSTGLPQINANGNFTSNPTIATNYLIFGGKTTSLQFGQPYILTGTLSANQLLFDGGFLMGVKAAKEFVELSRINVTRGEIETEVSVTKAYYLALLLQTNVSLLDTNIATLEKSRNDLEKMYANGLAEKTDFSRVSLQASNLKLQRDKLVDQQRIAAMILKLQMGMNVGDSITLTDKLLDLYTKTTLPVLSSQIEYSRRPEYKMLEQQIKLSVYDKKRYQMGYTPTISAFFNVQRNSFARIIDTLGRTFYPGVSWGVNMSIPIFDGLRKSAQIQQAKISIYKAQNDKKNLENVINQQVFQAKMSFERAGQQLKIQEENLQLAQEIYDRVTKKYDNGVGSSLELTTSLNDLATARQNYLQTIYDYFSAQIDLRKAVGDIK